MTAEYLNTKDLDRIRQMQEMDRYEPHERTIEDLLATLAKVLDVAITRGLKLGHKDRGFRASYRVITGTEYRGALSKSRNN